MSSIAATFTSNVTAGSLIVVAGGAYGQAIGSGTVTDNKSQSYTLGPNPVGTNVNLCGQYFGNAASGSTTVTLTPAASCDCDIAVLEYGGMTATPFDVSASHIDNAAGSTYDCGTTATTAQANEVVFYAATSEANSLSGAPTAPTSATLREHIETSANLPIMTADQTVSSTGTQTGTFTNADATNNAGLIMTFKIAGGAAEPYPAGYGRSLQAVRPTTVRM